MPERECLKLTPINPFTPDQQKIIQLVLNGHSRREIASEIGMSINTLKNYIEGRPKHNSPGIYGIMEKAYGTRPHGMDEAIGIIGGDVIIPQIENTNFEIVTTTDGTKQIKMKVDNEEWILFENRGAVVAGARAKILHSFGLIIKAGRAFDTYKSYNSEVLIPLEPKKGYISKMVGLYVRVEEFDKLSQDLRIKKYLENRSLV